MTHSSPKYIVGAYATAPSLALDDITLETEYYSEMTSRLSNLRGLEIPFFGEEVHAFGSDYLINLIQPSWENILTCIPASFYSLKKNKTFGLASDDNEGRAAAINVHKKANNMVKKINDHFGCHVIIATSIATAPSYPLDGVSSSSESLKRSLDELFMWNWDNSKLLIEHCDTSNDQGQYVKGFMPIDEEISILEEYSDQYRTGFVINWARSAIEGRDVVTPVKHIQMLANKKLLSGIVFSGTSSQDGGYGVWQDNHMPFAKAFNIKHYESNSLLTIESITKSLENINLSELDFVGIKLLGMPIESCSISRRVGLNEDALYVLDRVRQSLKNNLLPCK